MIGAAITRREDVRMLLGQTRYLDDLDRAGLAHVAFVRSPHAHARIIAIRAPSQAEGLIAMVTAADLDALVRPFPVPPLDDAELADEPHPVLAADEVRYAGQPIAAVIARTRAVAEDVAELVAVDYETEPAIVNPRDSDRALMRWWRRGGDVDGAFAAARHLIRGSYALPRLVAAPIETRGAIAEHDPDRDLLTVWCSAQDPHRPRAQLAHILSRPQDSLRVIVPDVGGAFGSKGVIAPEVAAIAAASIKLGLPLKWAEDRSENFLGAYQGRGIEGDVELALDAEGRMLGVRAQLWADLGAYLFPTTAIPPHTAAMLITGCYEIPAAEVRIVGARTHKVPTGPYRGAGRPEAAYMLERLVDQAAHQLGIDRIELRRRNLVRRFPHQTPLGWVYDSGDYERCLDLAVELAGLESHQDKPTADQDQRAADTAAGTVTGTGVALYVERAGGQWESAEIELEPSGRFVISSSACPHGQGHETTFAQIAADRLGCGLDQIVLRFGDSATVPRGVGTFGSRSVAMAGSAIVIAIDKLVALASSLAAHLLDCEPGRVQLSAGAFTSPARDGAVSWADLARAGYQPERLPPDTEVGLRAGARFHSPLVFSAGAHAAVVEIERATGTLRVLRIAAVDDAGTVINPLLVHGQVVGGVVQALGECLVEEAIHDDTGQNRNGSFMDYSLLTAAEIPPIVTAEVSSPSPLNPLGAKGAGEGGTVGTLPAVANAVADALGGLHLDPPYGGEKLWRALREASPRTQPWRADETDR